MSVFTLVWWKAALVRGGRTAVLVAVAYLPTAGVTTVPWLSILSAAALAFVLSLLTSLFNIPEVSGTASPWWFAALSRVIKTGAQAVIAGIGTDVFLNQVDWKSVLITAGTAAFGSLVLAVVTSLPESAHPVAAATVAVLVPSNNNYAQTAVAHAPITASSAPASDKAAA